MGFLGDLFTPTPVKQQEQLTTLLAGQVLKVMSSSKFSASGAASNTATITAMGTSKISGVDINQVATVNTAAFLSDQTTAQLKSDLKESLTNTIKNVASGMPFGQEPNVNTKISNVVDKSISQFFTHESMMELNTKASNVANITALDAATVSAIRLNQTATALTKFSNDVGTDIATQLIGTTTATSTTSTETKNWFADSVKAVGDSISKLFGTALLGVYAGPILMVVAFIAFLIIVAYVLKGSGASLAGPGGYSLAYGAPTFGEAPMGEYVAAPGEPLPGVPMAMPAGMQPPAYEGPEGGRRKKRWAGGDNFYTEAGDLPPVGGI